MRAWFGFVPFWVGLFMLAIRGGVAGYNVPSNHQPVDSSDVVTILQDGHCNVVFPPVHPRWTCEPIQTKVTRICSLLPAMSQTDCRSGYSGSAERGEHCAGSQLPIQGGISPVVRLLDWLRIRKSGIAAVIEKVSLSLYVGTPRCKTGRLFPVSGTHRWCNGRSDRTFLDHPKDCISAS